MTKDAVTAEVLAIVLRNVPNWKLKATNKSLLLGGKIISRTRLQIIRTIFISAIRVNLIFCDTIVLPI